MLAILTMPFPASCAYVNAMMGRLQQKGINVVLLSGDREEAVATIAKTVGIRSDSINASLSPQQKSGVISALKSAGHRVAMVTIFYWIPELFKISRTIYYIQSSNRSKLASNCKTLVGTQLSSKMSVNARQPLKKLLIW